MSSFQYRGGIAWSGGTPANLLETFKRYAEENGRDIEELVKKQSTELTNNLYRSTNKTTRAEITADVEAAGQGLRLPKVSQTALRKLKFALLTCKTREARKELLRRWTISIRAGRIGAERSGWVPAMRALGSKLSAGAANRRKFAGSVQINLAGLKPVVTIVNSTPGISDLNTRDHILERGIQLTIDNMQDYINRKVRERAELFSRGE
jgi:hypothetical protein